MDTVYHPRNIVRSSRVKALRKKVYSYYKKHGRHNLPWRKTKDPYKILVSEVMLQQTQVARVLPKYQVFIKQFPDLGTLTRAPLRDVFLLWSGLGYNRRAKYLHTLARIVVENHGGVLPEDAGELQKLPGIGHATARAVCAFAFNQPVVFVETNIRSVFLHHFFQKSDFVTDKEVLSLVKQTLDTKNPREWYWALMDYGVLLKTTYGNQNIKSAHYKKQTPFKGSQREVRGKIMKALTQKENLSEDFFAKSLGSNVSKIKQSLESLVLDGLIKEKEGERFSVSK